MDRVRIANSISALRYRRYARQGGFSFAEVLFAVMILGIGFIMIAAIFPVALVQSKLTQEETVGQSIARGGANYLEQIAANVNMYATGVTKHGRKLTGEVYDGPEVRTLDWNTAVRGGLVTSADPRLGWVPFYRREGTRLDPGDGPGADWASVAQVYMIPVAVRSRSSYDNLGVPKVVQGKRTTTTPNTEGIAVLSANIVDSTNPGNTDLVDYIEFPTGRGQNDNEENYTTVTEGSYVIIASAPQTDAGETVYDPTGGHSRVGHIFRIGVAADTQPAGATGYPRRWVLAPGQDYVPKPIDREENGSLEFTPLALNNLLVFVVGRSLTDPSLPYAPGTNARDGTGQEVGAFTTFVQIR